MPLRKIRLNKCRNCLKSRLFVQAQILVAKTKSILKLAIKKRGTTFRDYVDGSGMHGNFQKYLKVYGRDGEPCLICKTPLSSTRLGQRATVYCPKCQKGNINNKNSSSLFV